MTIVLIVAMAKTLTVHRKGYERKAHTRKSFVKKDGTRVKGSSVKKTRVPPTTFKIKDVGAPGRGPKVIKIKHPGRLSGVGYSIDDSAKERHESINKAVKRYGATWTWRALNAQVRFREKAGVKGEIPRKGVERAFRIFRADRNYVKKKYGGPKPTAAIKKWKKMSPKARAKAMPGGKI